MSTKRKETPHGSFCMCMACVGGESFSKPGRKARRPKALKLQHMVLIAEPDRMCLDFDALCFFQVIDSIKEAKRLIRWLEKAVKYLEQEKSK